MGVGSHPPTRLHLSPGPWNLHGGPLKHCAEWWGLRQAWDGAPLPGKNKTWPRHRLWAAWVSRLEPRLMQVPRCSCDPHLPPALSSCRVSLGSPGSWPSPWWLPWVGAGRPLVSPRCSLRSPPKVL